MTNVVNVTGRTVPRRALEMVYYIGLLKSSCVLSAVLHAVYRIYMHIIHAYSIECLDIL